MTSIPHEREYDVVATKAASVANAVKAIDHADFGFSAAELAAATRAVISTVDGPVQYTYAADVDPATTRGHTMTAGGSPHVVWGNRNINNLKFIREDTTDGAVTVTLETEPGTYATTTSTSTTTSTTTTTTTTTSGA